jgi:hypothetical protein
LFDPTIFDNLKVVLEGSVYDLDLEGSILVTNRTDRVELATMSRCYAIRFRELKETGAQAEMALYASMTDLAAELLNRKGEAPGCVLDISFELLVERPEEECSLIEQQLLQIWDRRPQIRQTLSYEYGMPTRGYVNKVSLSFGRKLDEGNAEDLPRLVDYALRSLRFLNKLADQREK